METAMSQKNGMRLNDPVGNLRSLRDSMLDAWAKAMIDAVNTETFARALGTYLDATLATSAPIQQAVDQYMKQTLPRLSMPLRDDVTNLARRLTAVEMRLDDMEIKLDQISDALERQSPVLAELLGAQRDVPQTTADDLGPLQDRLQALDAKTDQLLRLIERIQPAAPAAALRRATHKPAAEPPVVAETKEEMPASER
jgi:TolA-binding protein